MNMNISKDLYAVHKNLSACSAAFLEFVKDNPESLIRSSFPALEIDYHHIRLQSWPTFIDKKTKEEIGEVGVKVCNLIKSVPRRFFSNDPTRVSQYYEISEHMARIMLDGVDETHIDNLLGRGDFIFSPSGLKCLEYNIAGNIGGWEAEIWMPLYLKTPILSRFLQQYKYKEKLINENFLSIFLTHLIRTALDKFPGSTECSVINTAFVSRTQVVDQGVLSYLNRLYDNIVQLRGRNTRLKGRIILCDYHDLEVVDDVVFYKGEPVHVLVERYGGIVPPAFTKVFKKGNVIIYNGPISGLMSNKFNLAVLSENRDSHIFTPEEREIIKKHIPWTRKISPGETTFAGKKVNLEDFILSHREQLVVKPSIGFGGKEVYIGKNMDETRWREIVKSAVRRKVWLVQELVESNPYLYQTGVNGCAPHHAVWGFFVFGSRYAGGWVRVIPVHGKGQGVINTSRGAEESVIFEIDE